MVLEVSFGINEQSILELSGLILYEHNLVSFRKAECNILFLSLSRSFSQDFSFLIFVRFYLEARECKFGAGYFWKKGRSYSEKYI
jgi:hypothetical protein